MADAGPQPFEPAPRGSARVDCLSLPALAVLRLHRPDETAIAATSDALGFQLPLEPNRWSAGPTPSARLAPGEWLIRAAPVVAELSERLTGIFHHISEVGPGRAAWRVSGPAAADLLASGCSLDLHGRAFPPRSAARTLVAGFPALVSRLEEEAAFEVIADRSVKTYLDRWLADAAEGLA